jgi:hypothetical protein
MHNHKQEGQSILTKFHDRWVKNSKIWPLEC